MTPVLYSFRRCPYAIRARMALLFAQQTIDLIEVDLKNKPAELLALSPKATVPVLKIDDTTLLEESLDIMEWALAKHNPFVRGFDQQHPLIKHNDGEFKKQLDCYKYADRYPHSQALYQREASAFLYMLNDLLTCSAFLQGEQPTAVDVAIFPFIRQFSFVDKAWFDEQPWQHLQTWLNFWLEHPIFKQAFKWGRE